MILVVISAIVLCTIGSPASAEEVQGVEAMLPNATHWAITVLGIAVAARLAVQAFGRAVPVAEVPTFPRYMTSRAQYRLGCWIFVIFACSFFWLLVHEHRQVIEVAPLLGVIPANVVQAAKQQSAPYLLIIGVMGMVYLYLLTKETSWNVLLMMRDVIQSWISVPQLVKQIMAQIRYSLRITQQAIGEVIASSPGVVEQDFHKDPNTPDRVWAETCYMKWWLTQGHEGGEDATFFTEDSFGFDALIRDFHHVASVVREWKAGTPTALATADVAETIKSLHNRFSRLVACYLIYRNGSRKDLRREAEQFGVELIEQPLENPLRYSIVYMLALGASIYVGVHASATGYDLLMGKGLLLDQDPNLAVKWIMYCASNWGLAIVTVLLLRFVAISLGGDLSSSHLVTYCWMFVVASFVGPFGLTLAVHYFAPPPYDTMQFGPLYFDMLKWGLGPALSVVYIAYYLDRQTCHDLPDIDHSPGTRAWRLINCLGFAGVTVFVLLPQLLALKAQPDAAWDSSKLRFVATATTFCMALALALTAQFALKKGPPPHEEGMLSPRLSG